jgi:hypothetical protein
MITAAEPVAAGTYTAPDGEVFTKSAGVLQDRGNFDADVGLEHQDRGLDASQQRKVRDSPRLITSVDERT